MTTVTKLEKVKFSSFGKQLKSPSHQLEFKLVSESANRSCSIQDKSNKTTGFPINACRVGTGAAATARAGRLGDNERCAVRRVLTPSHLRRFHREQQVEDRIRHPGRR